MDAAFFHRTAEEHCGQIRFQVSNLEWAAEQIFSILDKVRILSPCGLQQAVQRRVYQALANLKGDI